MSDPFIREYSEEMDFRNKEIGPAWFSRRTNDWKINTESPILLGGESGGTLKRAILDVITETSEVLAICSFLISDEDLLTSILDASNRGVRVYILTPSKDRIERTPIEEDARRKEMRESHENMLNQLCSKTLLRDAQVHAKFILSDPNSTEKRGILSTANFTTDAFTHPEIGLILSNPEIDELFTIFANLWWELGERELLEAGVLTVARKLIPSASKHAENKIKFLDHLSLTHPAGITSLREEIRRIIRESNDKIMIATYGISDDDIVFKELESSSSNKEIRILVRQRPKLSPVLQKLKRKDVDIRGLDYLHAKAVCAETENGLEALLMTANLEKISLQDGFEVGILAKDEVAKNILKVLDHWWENANWEYLLSKKLGNHMGAYLVLNDREFEKHDVQKAKPIPLGEFVIDDLALLESFKPKFPDISDTHQATFYWTTQPRQLPKKCKPHKIQGLDESIKVWKCDKNRVYISVSNQEELDRVLRTPERPQVPIVYHKS